MRDCLVVLVATLIPQCLAAQVTLTGDVLEVRSGRPIAGALVTEDSLGITAIANEAGRFQLVILGTDPRRLTVSARGDCFEAQTVFLVTSNASDMSFRLMLSPGRATLAACRPWLDVPGALGRVFDSETGEPVANVSITVRSPASRVITTRTDAQGAFMLSGMTEGWHDLEFRHQCYFIVSTRILYALDYPAPVTLNVGLPFHAQLGHSIRWSLNDALPGCLREN